MTPSANLHSTLDPIKKSIVVTRTPKGAFELFTTGLSSWWPLATHSVCQKDAESVVLEPKVGGRLVEKAKNGAEHVWGHVTRWEPFEVVAFTWHPGRGPETRQEVEVRFAATREGTRVELEHRGWERLGDLAAETRKEYTSGWDAVLGKCYGGAAGLVP